MIHCTYSEEARSFNCHLYKSNTVNSSQQSLTGSALLEKWLFPGSRIGKHRKRRFRTVDRFGEYLRCFLSHFPTHRKANSEEERSFISSVVRFFWTYSRSLLDSVL